jgi:lia operon protein LiaG
MPRNAMLPLGIAAAGLVVIGWHPAVPQGERYELTGERVAVYNLAGTVALEAGRGEVTVEVVRQGGDASQLRIEQGAIRGRRTLRVVYPSDRVTVRGMSGSTEIRVREDGTFGDGDSNSGRRVRISDAGGGLAASADLRVTVPAGRSVAVYLAVGEVTVSNVDGELILDTGSAPVRTSGTRGSLEIDVGSGRVEVTGAEGDVSIDTGSGSVSATRVRGDALQIDTGSGSVTASDIAVSDLGIDTGSGGVEVTSATARQVLIATGSGSVKLALTANPEDVSIDTGSGSVTVTVPATFAAEVDLETSSGGIELDFPVTTNRIERNHLQGVIGAGGGRLAVDTGSGSIRIVRGS